MKSRTPRAIVLALAGLSACLGPGCGNTTNDGGVNATKSIVDSTAPKTQEEYARQQLARDAAAKKAARPGR
jgi:hypothetical protein